MHCAGLFVLFIIRLLAYTLCSSAGWQFFQSFCAHASKHHFPHISLLALGALAFTFSLLFRLGDIITAIVTMRILIQFVSQAVGLIAWHINKPKEDRPYKMPLFPVPAIISILIWFFILCSSEFKYIAYALGIIVSGLVLYVVKEKIISKINLLYFKGEYHGEPCRTMTS